MDYSTKLRSLLEQVGIPSFKALGRAADVSDWQIEQLRRGKVAQMRVETLLKISQVLQISLPELITHFSESIDPSSSTEKNLANERDLQQEYQRLQTQLEQQRELLQQEFQQATLHVLESWLTQFPTLVHAAQQNSEVPANKLNLVVFMRPIDRLIQSWGIESIAPIGSEVPYDPQMHQFIPDPSQPGRIPQPGEIVRVRYAGYRQGDKLLHRAKVGLITP